MSVLVFPVLRSNSWVEARVTWLGWTPVKRKSCLFLSVWGEGTQGLACRGAECGWAGGQGSMWALIYEESALPKSEFVKMVFGVRILFFLKYIWRILIYRRIIFGSCWCIMLCILKLFMQFFKGQSALIFKGQTPITWSPCFCPWVLSFPPHGRRVSSSAPVLLPTAESWCARGCTSSSSI